MKPIVKLIAITQGAGELAGKTAQEVITYNARVSNPGNQNNFNTAAGLLRFCIREEHWSIFEQADLTLEINTTRGIAPQILRHKSFFFQEFCLSGDTEIYFDLPHSLSSNKRDLHKMKLEDIHRKWNENDYKKNKMQNMHIRIYDEDTKEFTHSTIKEVYKTGVKPLFEITLENGKKIKSTKEHKFYTENGFMSLEDAVNLKVNNNTATMGKESFFACNGVPVYQNYEWMKLQKEKSIEEKTGVHGIADTADVSYHTIRKWLKRLNLQFTKSEVASYTEVWNKGRYGYSWGKHSQETIELMRLKAKKGEDSNLWRGGVDRDWRIYITDEISKDRKFFFEKYNYSCNTCGSSEKLQLHHIIPVFENPNLALDKDNIEVLCKKCHSEHHKNSGHHKIWSKNSKGNTLSLKYSKVVSVKYIGEEMTYDLEINHKNHNYIANGIVVHNSQRYADTKLLTEEIPQVELRRQDVKNRQNSTDDLDPELVKAFHQRGKMLFAESQELYDDMLESGVAKESARFYLPIATPTRLYMKGTVRSWIHYISLRAKPATQKEHRDIAEAAKCIFCCQFPDIAEALEWERSSSCPDCNDAPSITLE